MVAGNTATNSECSEVEHTTDPGIPIQSEYSVIMAVSTDDTEQIPSEYSLAGNVYSELRREQPESATVNKSKKIFPPVDASPQAVNTSPNQVSFPSEVVYAQPDLSKKRRKTLQTSEPTDQSPPPIPPQADVL